MIKIASFNVENLFARPKAFRDIDPATEQPVLEAFREVNELIKKQTRPSARTSTPPTRRARFSAATAPSTR